MDSIYRLPVELLSWAGKLAIKKSGKLEEIRCVDPLSASMVLGDGRAVLVDKLTTRFLQSNITTMICIHLHHLLYLSLYKSSDFSETFVETESMGEWAYSFFPGPYDPAVCPPPKSLYL